MFRSVTAAVHRGKIYLRGRVRGRELRTEAHGAGRPFDGQRRAWNKREPGVYMLLLSVFPSLWPVSIFTAK